MCRAYIVSPGELSWMSQSPGIRNAAGFASKSVSGEVSVEYWGALIPVRDVGGGET